MSYRKTNRRFGLGSTAGDVVNAAVNVASDPCLGQVAQLLNTLHTLEQKPLGLAGGYHEVGATDQPGIGLCKAVVPLKAAVFVKQHPLATGFGAMGLVLGLIGLGYVIGKDGRK